MRKGILIMQVLFTFLATAAKAQEDEFRFKPPVNIGSPVNTSWDEEDPYLTGDGQRLFFSSDRPGGVGSYDIWLSTWNGTGWGDPVNLGSNVNGGADEWSPSLSPDGKKLYFTAFGRPGSLGAGISGVQLGTLFCNSGGRLKI